MNDVCIPIPRIEAEQVAEVEVSVNGEKRKFSYRLEAFEWGLIPQKADTPVNTRINHLRSSIESYNQGWELVQIYNPRPNDSHIHVLFRQRGHATAN
ncbi:MAG: hypothetical protein ACE5I1_12695 [bacterium]